MTIINDYLDLQDKYEKRYGEKTIVLMEVGGFFEIYGIVNDFTKRGRIYEISDITNLSISKKCSKTQPISIKNPLMAGFPNHSFSKWRDILLKNNYTIIKIEQDSHGTKDPKRTVTEIISPGVNIETTNFTNNMMSIYLEEFKCHKTTKPVLQIGISIIDVTTGDNYVYETHSNPDDYTYALDEIFRFIGIFNPSEIIFHFENTKLDKEKIENYLQIYQYQVHFNIYNSDKYNHILKNKFKDQILNKIFKNIGNLTPVEYISMEKMHFALNAFIYLLQFIYDHNENIILKLLKPKIWEPSKYLVLSHDSIYQLNIIPDKNKQYISGINSLWDVLDKTKTAIGKRFLKDNLLNPIINSNLLNKRYKLVETFLENDKYIEIRNVLKNIIDIERLHRRMAMKFMNPSSFLSLDLSYQNVNLVIQNIKNTNNSHLLGIIPDTETLNKFKEFILDYNDKLLMDKLVGINLQNITSTIFKKGLYKDIDKVQEKIDFYNLFLTQFQKTLSNLIDPSRKMVDLKQNDRDGHYFSITKSRLKTLKAALKDKDKLYINVKNKTVEISTSNLEIKSNTSGSKIFTTEIRNYSSLLVGQQQKMSKLCLEIFSELLQTYYDKYSIELKNITNFIGLLDFITNIAFVSKINNYFKPTIDERKESYLIAKGLRHPIIEKIHNKVQYIPNDIYLGENNQNGILLYGVNAVGKSCLMKSVGIAIIMAQTGFYVPAKNFIYSPYKHIFTRISNNDNIFKGQSTFAVEMSELRSILKRSTENSLILGDELCSGTETTSAISLVAAGILRLSEKNSSFIFATHLHKLSTLDEILNCKNVNNYHMETIFDKANNRLIYNRKLKNGSGSSIYGLEVAKAMDLDKEFIKTADLVRKKLMGNSETIVNNKTSQYNSEIIIDKCAICNCITEEVHHIKEQHLANNKGMIEDFHKNNLFNLVQLCHKCHHEVHHGKLIIKGYIQTTRGIELDYNYNDNLSIDLTRKKKYTKDQIDIIKDIYEKTKKYNMTKKLLNMHHKISISHPTLKKIVENRY